MADGSGFGLEIVPLGMGTGFAVKAHVKQKKAKTARVLSRVFMLG